MIDSRIPKGLFLVILAAAIAQGVHDFPLLPDRLASHFAASGLPNGWMTKSQFFALYAAMILVAAAVEFWMPRRIAKSGGNRLNLPNKEYWLAPGRRAETFAYFERFFAWYGCALLLLEVFAMRLAMRANLRSSPRLSAGPMVSALLAFVLFNLVAVAAMFRRFARPE